VGSGPSSWGRGDLALNSEEHRGASRREKA
jgi:hypothetical protein